MVCIILRESKQYVQCGQSASRFRAQPEHRREPASCVGGRENSLALQTLDVSRLCLWIQDAQCNVSCCIEVALGASVSSIVGTRYMRPWTLSSMGVVGGGKAKTSE